MRYRPFDLLLMLFSPLGRFQLADGILRFFWPLFYWAARGYRFLTSRATVQVAIVGSLGKTTSLRAVQAVIGVSGEQGQYRNFRTPVALKILSVPPWKRYGAIEVGIDGPGQMESLARMVKPGIVVVTSIASEHNQSLGNLENTRREKSMMVRALPENGLLVLNGDDPLVLSMKELTKAEVVTVGFGEDCDIRARNYQLDWPRGSCFEIELEGRCYQQTSRMIGRHMVYPVLFALGLGLHAGLNIESALRVLKRLPPTPYRLQIEKLPNGAYLIRDEFKSTIETIHRALDLLEDVPAPRRGIVLGDISEAPGAQGPLYRDLGERVAEIADWAVFYGKKRDAYAAGARRAGIPDFEFKKMKNDLAGAAEEVLRRLHSGDVVLVKGRGNQRLDRISLLLQGREVKCDLPHCDARTFRCENCPMRVPGWGNRRPII